MNVAEVVDERLYPFKICSVLGHFDPLEQIGQFVISTELDTLKVVLTLVKKNCSSHQFQPLIFSVLSPRSSVGGVARVTVFNSSTTWAATLCLWGYNYKCMLVIFVFP